MQWTAQEGMQEGMQEGTQQGMHWVMQQGRRRCGVPV